MLLDIRWTANSAEQARLSWQSAWQLSEEQRLSNDLDGDIYQYVTRVKNELLSDEPGRILIIGDDAAIDYLLLRAKYHLLPHSVDVAGFLHKDLPLESLDYVIFFGQPEGIKNARGWHRKQWRRGLKEIERNEWGAIYKVKH